ncbi:hypothetical protein Tco_0846675 [Tanacetum coccineum]
MTARKDLVRGLPRLKFEKDHLCSACQLRKSKKFSHRPKSENTNMEVSTYLHNGSVWSNESPEYYREVASQNNQIPSAQINGTEIQSNNIWFSVLSYKCYRRSRKTFKTKADNTDFVIREWRSEMASSFAPVARIEAIRIFIANAATKNMIILPEWMVKTALLAEWHQGVDDTLSKFFLGQQFSSRVVGSTLKLDEDLMGMSSDEDSTLEEWVWLPNVTYSHYADADHAGFKIQGELKDYGFDFNKIPLTVITKVLLLFAVTTSNTLTLNTSTCSTISSESKWKIEWLNSTSWKRIISLQTFSPKH